MASTEFVALKVSDANVLKALEELRQYVQPGDAGRFVVTIARGVPHIQGTYSEVLDHPALKELLSTEGRTLHEVVANIGPSNVHVKRDQPIDKVVLNYPDNFDPTQAARFLGGARRLLRPYDQAANIEQILGSEMAEFYRRRDESLIRLQELTQSLIEQNETYRRTVDKETATLRQRLEEEATAEQKRLRSEYEAKIAALTEREEALDTRTKALDDRSSRHARRQIRQDLKEILANRTKAFSLTKETAAKRIPVHLMYVLLIAVPAAVFLRSLFELVVRGGVADWLLLARMVVSGAGLAAALVYYIKWNDHWFRQHASEEFRLRRLDLDIDRASWVVETAFEWKEEKGTEIPMELVDRLTRNLFVTDDAGGRAVKHPGEDLASALLGASSRLNVQIPGLGDATLDRRGVRQLKKKAEEAE